MVWLYHSPIPEVRRGVISSFKLFLHVRRGRSRHPVSSTMKGDQGLATGPALLGVLLSVYSAVGQRGHEESQQLPIALLKRIAPLHPVPPVP